MRIRLFNHFVALFLYLCFSAVGQTAEQDNKTNTQENASVNSEEQTPDEISPEQYWRDDPQLQAAIKQQGKTKVIENIRVQLEQGAKQLNSNQWDPNEEQAASFALAMRWAAILNLEESLELLDAIAQAPAGKVELTLYYPLIYNARWAAWNIRTRSLTPAQRVDRLIEMWKGSDVSQRVFAEDRLLEEPAATQALVTLTLKDILPKAGKFKNNTLIVKDVTAAEQLGRLETLLTVKAQRSDLDRQMISEALGGTVLHDLILPKLNK